MRPFHVIGWRATAPAGYDCSFMVMYPLDTPVQEQQKLSSVCHQAVNEARRLHGNITIHSQMERHIMAN